MSISLEPETSRACICEDWLAGQRKRPTGSPSCDPSRSGLRAAGPGYTRVGDLAFHLHDSVKRG